MEKMKVQLIPYFALAMISMATNAFGDPQTKQNSKGITVEVSGIEQQYDCHPGTFDGLIVKREFGHDGVTLNDIVVQNVDGTRSFINVSIPDDMSMALRGGVVDGLQRLSKVGRRARGRIYYCGAAGRVLNLEAIR
jgi:hypothetical protein